jgi:hypothetical protein
MKTNFASVSGAALFAAAVLASNPAQAVTTVYTTGLSSAGETVSTSSATGSAIVTFDDVLNGVSVQLSFAGLANEAPFGHIHCCTAVPGSGNAGVALNFGALPAASTGSFAGSFSLASTAFNSLLTGVSTGKAYVNIHTPGTYAGGEIRGFLAPSGVVAAIPEPETYALMLAGLGAVAWAARRRSA